MKGFAVCLLFAVSSLAEPPVDNRYLPPQAFRSPSPAYGAPAFGGQRQANRAGFRSRPSSTYGAPSRAQSISKQYIPPHSSNQAPISLYQAPAAQYQAPSLLNAARSSVYQAPSAYRAPVQQYQAPSAQYGLPNQAQSSSYQAQSSSYQAPSAQYGLPNQAQSSLYQAPSAQYGLPNQAQSRGSFAAPSQQYGLPGLDRADTEAVVVGGVGGDYSQSRQYLPPGRSYDDGSNGEPANYDFEYMVLDQESGTDFGHQESRRGARAEGAYYVLLPDGRRQTVQYEADEEGYKPRISYDDSGARAAHGAPPAPYEGGY